MIEISLAEWQALSDAIDEINMKTTYTAEQVSESLRLIMESLYDTRYLHRNFNDEEL